MKTLYKGKTQNVLSDGATGENGNIPNQIDCANMLLSKIG